MLREGPGSPARTLLPPSPAPLFRVLASRRVTAVTREQLQQKKVDTAAKVEAHACLRSLINGSAQVLSSSWFFLLSGEATAPAAASGGAVGRGGATGDVLRTAGVSSEATATVSIVAVRRLAHTCGVIRSGAGGPTLAHADMQLRRNAVGKGRLGYREVWGL